jgi:hypothetical protein
MLTTQHLEQKLSKKLKTTQETLKFRKKLVSLQTYQERW